MALRMGYLYDALRSLRASEEVAAAEEAAGYENRPAAIDADLRLLKWMVGASIALHFVMLEGLFRLMSAVSSEGRGQRRMSRTIRTISTER